MSEPGGPSGATNDHACRDWTISVRQLSMTPVGETGFRFVRIDLLTEGAGTQFVQQSAILLYRDIPYLGSFSCSEPAFEPDPGDGAYTVHLNMQQYIWTASSATGWNGSEICTQNSTIQAVFGDQQVIRDSLDLVTSQAPADQWMNVSRPIPCGGSSFSMITICSSATGRIWPGNCPYLKKLTENRVRAYRSGRKGLYAGKSVSGWPTKGDPSSRHGDPGAAHSCGAGKQPIFRALGEALAQQAESDCTRLLQYRPEHCASKQAAALAALAGLLDAADANETILKRAAPPDCAASWAIMCCWRRLRHRTMRARSTCSAHTGAACSGSAQRPSGRTLIFGGWKTLRPSTGFPRERD